MSDHVYNNGTWQIADIKSNLKEMKDKDLIAMVNCVVPFVYNYKKSLF